MSTSVLQLPQTQITVQAVGKKSFSLPDVFFLLQNFLLGTLSHVSGNLLLKFLPQLMKSYQVIWPVEGIGKNNFSTVLQSPNEEINGLVGPWQLSMGNQD